VGVQEAPENGPIDMTAADLSTKALKLLYAGATQEALDALTEAIQLDPESAEAYSYRGVAYYQLGDYDSALEGYDKAIAL
jgi:Flp pilus assembly protein TadD